MNFEEIKTKLTELQTEDDFLYELSSKSQPYKSAFGEIEEVNSEGDREDGGDYSEKVFHFKEHGIYVKITGSYSSYEGTEWDYDWSQVTPKEKTITVYE